LPFRGTILQKLRNVASKMVSYFPVDATIPIEKGVFFMLMHEPSTEDIANWKQVFAAYQQRLKPNRKTGEELLAYLRAHYTVRALEDADADQVVIQNILLNESLCRELPPGTAPKPVCGIIEPVGAGEALYREQDACFAGIEIFVGIDLTTRTQRTRSGELLQCCRVYCLLKAL